MRAPRGLRSCFRSDHGAPLPGASLRRRHPVLRLVSFVALTANNDVMPPPRDDIVDVLRTIDDPEMPISIVDLGIVEDVVVEPAEGGAAIHVTVLPTFVGCPALPMIREEIESKVGAVEGVASVEVTFTNDPPWTVDRITEAGRAQLREHGVTVPVRGAMHGEDSGGAPSATVTLTTSIVPCPFCGSTHTHLDSAFGPTRCRMIYYCDACRNSFEHMKKV